jgi:hypothetical protein
MKKYSDEKRQQQKEKTLEKKKLRKGKQQIKNIAW